MKPPKPLAGDPPPITPQGGVLDTSALAPGVRWLILDKMTIPDGELAKVPDLERLVITYPRGAELDLSGCRNLAELRIMNGRHLERIRGLEDAEHLEQLLITSCRQLREVPDLSHAVRLTDVEIGPLDVAPTVAPALAAPNLEMLELRGAVPLAPGDVEAIRDHPALIAFSWAAVKVPRAVTDRVHEMVGRPWIRPATSPPTAPPPAPAPAAGTAGANIDLEVRCSMATGYGSYYPVYMVGDIMLDGAPDVGPAVKKIEIDLFPEETPKGGFAPEIREWNAFRQKLPEIRFRRSVGSVLIRAASGLEVPRLKKREPEPAIPLFRQACTEVLAALELLKKRIKPGDDFDLEALLEHCRGVFDRIPESKVELDALYAAAERRRVQARQARSSARGFPGWMPGDPAPETL